MRSRLFLAIAAAFSISYVVSAQYSWQVQFPSLPAFALPLELVHANDGTNRLFVVQQRGIIYVFENTSGVSTRTVFLDISDRVSQSGSETGLLGLAFHPNYPDSGYFYVNYTSSSSGSLRSYVARYSVSSTNPDSALHDSEIILLTLDQPYENHNGGKLAFGPDGYLYLGFGDGGSGNDPGNRAQDRTVLLGKILRINVDSTETGLNYAIPPSNPYYRNALGYREEIYAYGVRNPWKFSFDPVTGKLWVGDVGQSAREEVDTVVNGGNYGWRLMEGSICAPGVNPGCQDTAGLIRPVWDYGHLTETSDGSITGGYVYRGSAIPSLYGKYIFGDYVSGRTSALTYDGTSAPSSSLLSDESFLISTFGVDTSGNIYLCSYGSSGRIYKLIGPESLPVELTSFSATARNSKVDLAWVAATEVNSYGFEIERRAIGEKSLLNSDNDPSQINQSNIWQKVGFVEGHGTTNAPHNYSFTDNTVAFGKYSYRLKQIDRDGKFEYSIAVESTVGITPNAMILGQNYPNPFNPESFIDFVVPVGGVTSLRVYDVLGQVVATLVNENLDAGVVHQARFDGKNFPSGLYFYTLRCGNFVNSKKMLMLK